METESTSFSKKGLGGFASKVTGNESMVKADAFFFLFVCDFCLFSQGDFLANKFRAWVLGLTTLNLWRTEWTLTEQEQVATSRNQLL